MGAALSFAAGVIMVWVCVQCGCHRSVSLFGIYPCLPSLRSGVLVGGDSSPPQLSSYVPRWIPLGALDVVHARVLDVRVEQAWRLSAGLACQHSSSYKCTGGSKCRSLKRCAVKTLGHPHTMWAISLEWPWPCKSRALGFGLLTLGLSALDTFGGPLIRTPTVK
jgi:hypothetical protein